MKTRRIPKETLESRCRFCLKQGTLCLFQQTTPAADDVSVLEKVKSITGLDLQAVNRSASRICDACLRIIADIYAFKMLVHNSQKRLQRQVVGKNCRPGR